MVLKDYATRYFKGVLRSTKASVMAKELIKVSSQVGFLREILTDRGSNLMGEVMQELWRQLGMKHLYTNVYQLQCNGLVERLNQTIKRMLKPFAIEDLTEWPEMIESILFALMEVPHALTGYSPFELLFGRRHRGVLDLIREQWEAKVTI